MTAEAICDRLVQSLGGLFQCAEHGEFQRIRTPYLYPDGDVIDLFCKIQGDIVTVTDLGETIRWLHMQTVSPRRTQKQKILIDDVCQNHGVELYKGMLLARCTPIDNFASVVTRVGQASLRVADLWFTFRTKSVQSVADEVEDYLSDRQLNYERGEKHVGRSGRTWTVDFHIRTARRSSLVYVLATGSRSAARSVTEHVLAAWYDLSQLGVGPEAIRFLSLFDDTVDVWSEEDFKLLEPLSTVSRWSDPDGLAREIQEAA